MKTSFNSISVCVSVCVCESYAKVAYTYDVIELFHFQLPNVLLKFVYIQKPKDQFR